jgi:hypothetical protein
MSQPTEQLVNPGPKNKKPIYKRWWFITGAFLLVFFIGIGAGGSDPQTTTATGAGSSAQPTPATVTVTKTTAAKAGAAPKAETVTKTVETTVTETVEAAAPESDSGSSEISDGTYLVGDEIKPGTWKSSGADGGLCYADTKSKGGTIQEQEVAAEGSVVMRVKSSAYTFTARGCGSWKKVD